MNPRSQVIWITGLSAAGKTTLATTLCDVLRRTMPVVQLDGDALREIFGASSPSSLHHNREARLALAMRYAHLCRVLAQPGITVVIATISMFREVYEWNRKNLPGYVEIYLNVPIDELQRRDPKGIYRQRAQGSMSYVAGIDFPVDEPSHPDLHFVGSSSTKTFDFVEKIIHFLNSEPRL